MIRAALLEDLPRVVEIYNASIPARLATADTQPVTLQSRRAWFTERGSQHPLWVYENNGVVEAWLSFGPFYGRPAYAATSELGVYVHPRAQRQGLGRALLQRAVEHSPALGFKTLLGFVFAHNAPSLALCQGFGFETWGHLPRVAELDGVERDVLILGLRVDA